MAQPPSLVALASHVVALHSTKLVPLAFTEVPVHAVENVACRLKGVALANFLEEHKSIMNIKTKFSCDAFQRFLLNVYYNLETCENKSTRQVIKKHHMAFKEDYKTDKCFVESHTTPEGKLSVLYLGTMDWNIVSLGLNWNLIKSKTDELHEFKFFQSKFEETLAHEKYPCPDIPASLAHLVNAEATCEFNLPVLEPPKNGLQVSDYNGLAEQFFVRLVGMAQAFRYFRQHEVLAYALDFLYQTKYLKSPYLSSYYFYIYGFLAVTLAQLHVDYAWVKACLTKMDSYVRVLSHRLDVTFFVQQVCYFYHQFDMEKLHYQKLVKCIPMSSEFYIQTVSLHFHASCKYMENLMMDILLMQRSEEDEEQIELNQAVLKKCLRQTKRFLYRELSKKHGYDEKLENMLDILSCYAFVVETINDEEGPDISYLLQLKMKHQVSHLRYFFERCSDDLTLSSYNDKLTTIKIAMEREAHRQDVEKWANLCFTHGLFFVILSAYVDLGEEKLKEAMRVYKKTKNDRAAICHKFLNYGRQSKPTLLNKSHVEFDVPKLLSSVPNLAGLAHLGQQSILKYNLYW